MGCVRVLRHSAAVKLPIPEQVAHQRWLLWRLRNRRFYGLAEVNNAIRELLVRLNE